MAERRRARGARRRRQVQRKRTDGNNNQIDAHAQNHLRAFVRVLARQAAREAFEAEIKRGSESVH